jgi:hypothetical protein
VAAIARLQGPSAISPLVEMSLSGVQFEATALAELHGRQFTVRIAGGVVTKGLFSETARIDVSGEFTFKTTEGATTSSKLTALTGLESGILFIRHGLHDKLTLKLTLAENSTPSDQTFNYEVTKAVGAFGDIRGTGKLAFSGLFPSDTLADSDGDCRAALT